MTKNKPFLYTLLFLFCINAGLLSMIHHNWNSSMKSFFSIQKELFSIRNSITEAHLWFEEMVNNDKSIDMQKDIIIPLEHLNFEKYINLLNEQTFGDDKNIQKYLTNIDEHLDSLYSLAILRLDNLESSGTGSVNDQLFDKEFKLCLFAIDSAITQISDNFDNDIIEKNTYFKYVFFFFIITNIIIFVMILVTRSKNLKQAKLMSEQIKMASLGEMLGNIAHQWRQPLSIISTGVTGMQVQKQYDLLDDEMFQKTCNSINQNVQYLSKTIDDFSDFIKGESEKNDFNLKEEINSFLSLVDTVVSQHELEIIVDVKPDIQIFGYKNELTQCLINIFHNSKDAFLDHSDLKKRYIFITAGIKKDILELRIKDNAGGIPDQVLKKIFEPYFTTKHKSQGTGLGLHMTYNLINTMMNGKIKASTLEYFYKDLKCVGAEFLIEIPVR